MADLRSNDVPSVIAAARNGSFRAISYWLNQTLVAQGIYVHVQAAGPGCLRTLVEFHRQPSRNRLVRFICHRLWLLESDLIEGVQIIARHIGSSQVLWQQSVRIPTRSERQERQQPITHPTKSAEISAFPPSLRRSRRWLGGISSPQQLKLVRAFFLSGSAIAAFVVGVWLEVAMSRPSPELPLLTQTQSQEALPPPPHLDRPELVNAALETVAVIQHEALTDPLDPTVTLLFGGEVSPEDVNIKAAAADPIALFDELETSQAADLTLVSLGQPLASAATSLAEEYHQRSRLDAVTALQQAGVEIVNLASTEVADYGETGLLEAIASLDRAGIYRTGVGRDMREARRPEIIEVKGQRIAYLAYAGDDWVAAGVATAGTSPQKHEIVAADIQAIRDQVDWIVVNYRWGDELTETTVTDWQIDLARFAIDQGADVVVGQHPDILQGAEIYQGRPIAYSLGEFVFADGERADYDSAVFKVALRPAQMKVDFVPVVVRSTTPHLATGDRGAKILDQIQQASSQFESPLQVPMVLDLKSPPDPSLPVDPAAPFVEEEALDGDTPGAPAAGEPPAVFPADPTLQEVDEPIKDELLKMAPPADETVDGPTIVPSETVPTEAEVPDLVPDRQRPAAALPRGEETREALTVIPPEEEPLVGPLVQSPRVDASLSAAVTPAADGVAASAVSEPEVRSEGVDSELAIAVAPLAVMQAADLAPGATELTVASPPRTITLPFERLTATPSRDQAVHLASPPTPTLTADQMAVPAAGEMTPRAIEPKPKLALPPQ